MAKMYHQLHNEIENNFVLDLSCFGRIHEHALLAPALLLHHHDLKRVLLHYVHDQLLHQHELVIALTRHQLDALLPHHQVDVQLHHRLEHLLLVHHHVLEGT